MVRGEPVELHLFPGRVVRVQRWLFDLPDDPHAREELTVGHLVDGRWFVDLVGPRAGSRAYPSEAQARDVAGRLMASSGPWLEVPATYDAQQRPADPGPWERVAGVWRRPDGYVPPPRTG